ncbi:T4 bacteriophage base plate protein [Rivularia sp. PCC 7116]|uniref:T4 family baseplate hub assembly chaperone n=1 Tax=Rivularia sp. PCC 7116 TaxID=373994 RepID=UPI00029F4528|nr:T4 bacteriophage base plate protein [Rivularia sp. PCC 7116]AFY57578.1 T4 bacteriophage base plate protein [Rivularia sp. PCC 7116]
MRPLSAQQILRIWEIGQSQHPLDRALTLLAFACPEISPPQLACLSIGQRDAYLLTLREITFGQKMNGLAECPNCGDRLEFDINIPDIRVAEILSPKVEKYNLQVEGVELQFRLPNSKDLAAIVGYKDVNKANSVLMQCCILQASQSGNSLDYDDLSATVINQLVQQMAECDPQAEILLNLSCPACQHSWQLLFDIVSFFWTELTARAKRLLQEVHTLARFYGWREADILSMSSIRRQMYLDLIGS